MYRCAECDEVVDDDWHPCAEGRNPLDLVCPDCVALMEEEVNGEDYRKPRAPFNPRFTKDQLSIIKKLEAEAVDDDESPY